MKNKGIHMIREGNIDIIEISKLVKSKLNAELVYENWRYTNDVRSILCVSKNTILEIIVLLVYPY